MKNLIGKAIFASRLSALLLRNKAVVVSFHRVQATVEPGDPLTVGAEMFERHCRFFRRYFRVVPLRAVVEKLERRQPLNGELAITFDDGYRDNFETAAPVLRKLSLPATFFVVTQWMGTEHVPWWDRERNVRHPWMTWDQVRALHRQGFDIGAHTRTHADLGRISGDQARRELVGARLDLETEIGVASDLFAYPYGGPHHLSQSNREQVKAAGFRCCCASSGGTNATGGDPFDLARIPISGWHASPHQFGFELALGRSLLTA